MIVNNKPMVLVTGYSSGIGKAFVSNKKIRDKFSFVFVGRTRPKDMENYDIFFRWDLEKQQEKDLKLFKNIKLEGMFVAHGVMAGQSFNDISEEDLLMTINTNLVGPIRLIKSFAQLLIEKSTVIFVSSISASKGSFDDVYAASKGGLESFSKSLSIKLAPKGIRVVSVAPGLVEGTRMTSQMIPGLFEETIAKIPMGIPASPDAIASFVFDIMQNKDLTVSGSIFAVNGGQFVQ